jgi:hypothetical protein
MISSAEVEKGSKRVQHLELLRGAYVCWRIESVGVAGSLVCICL